MKLNIERYHFETVTSTNDFAKELLQKNDCVVVTANFQTKGRGRNKNVWLGDFGQNVYFSLAIKHNDFKRLEEVAYLQGLAAIVVQSALRELCPKTHFVLKYPNDVYAKCQDGKYRKISGILIEHQFLGEFCSSSIIGIGINVKQKSFPAELQDSATSIIQLGYETSVEDVISKLLEYFDKYFALLPSEVFSLWVKELNIIGKQIRVLNKDATCEVVGIDTIGCLMAKINDTDEVLTINDGDSIRYEF
jgi:BirA family biotin operon repressor/biotin-[acetyl-CoA-carboxylase] ligase